MSEPDDDALLAALVTLGVPADEARAAVEDDRVALALVQHLTTSRGTLTMAEVAERGGVDLEVLRERYRMLGVADHALLDEGEVEDAKLIARLLQDLPATSLLRVMQVDAQALHRVALAHLEIAHDELVQPLRDSGGDEVAVALALAEAHSALTDPAARLLASSYRHVLERLLFSELVAEATRSGTDQAELAVGFADVVGYTSLSARIDPAGLQEVIEAFEARSFTVAALHAEVELVKFLGDAVMLVSSDVICLTDVLLELVTPADADSPLAGSPIRAGLAWGPVIMRGGDYFGPTVNIAARLTERARAGRVLAAEDLRAVLGERFSVRRVPPMTLRGIGRSRPVTVRRPSE